MKSSDIYVIISTLNKTCCYLITPSIDVTIDFAHARARVGVANKTDTLLTWKMSL